MTMVMTCIGFSIFTGMIFILTAVFMKRHPPKDMNAIYGYRTPRSMKNMELWKEGNRYSTELMLKQGYVIIIGGSLTGIGLGAWYPTVAIFAIMVFVTVLAILMIIKVESKLRKMDNER